MKKATALLLALVLALTFTACGGGQLSPTPATEATLSKSEKAFNASSEAFGIVDEAYQLTEQFGEDIYEAWRIGINDKDKVSISYFAKELNLTEADITAAIDDLGGAGTGDYYFTYYKSQDNLFSACVWMVSKAYELNGTTQKIENDLSRAKSLMKDMSAQYSDYEHYPNLKGYYTTTNAFFEFCKDPTGSFNQVVDTINGYRNDARKYRNELAYIFDDD
jgi:hypothetical protein